MQQPGKLTEIETYWIAVLLAASRGALFLALLPLAFGQFAMTDAAVWRIASLAMAGYGIVAGAIFLAAARRVRR